MDLTYFAFVIYNNYASVAA